MRLLVLGAGGTGGYFGGRLAQAGADVTFLVREGRAAQLDADGLVIRSPLGDAQLPVKHLVASQLAEVAQAQPFDLVLLSCKAYDLASSIDAIAPAMGEGTQLLPILNGLRHYQVLDERFGFERVLGGLCFISATKNAQGEVLHLGRPASITFGEREGQAPSQACADLGQALARATVEHGHSPQIERDIWIKYSFLCALAAATCLMRADIGTIVATGGGEQFIRELYDECLAVAAAAGWPVPEAAQAKALQTLLQPGSTVTASMLRDLQAGLPIEGEHIVGDMVLRSFQAGLDAPMLALGWIHLQAYQLSRQA